MTEINKTAEKLKQLLKSGKITYMLLIFGVLSALMIIGAPSKKDQEVSEVCDETEKASYENYITDEIAAIVSAITGEASPHVTVTLKTSGETVYATEDRKSEKNTQEYSDAVLNRSLSDDDTEMTYIILKDADGAQKPLIIMQKKPEVQGVVIVSSSGNDPLICEKITEAVKTALNLSSTQVCVTGQANINE